MKPTGMKPVESPVSSSRMWLYKTHISPPVAVAPTKVCLAYLYSSFVYFRKEVEVSDDDPKVTMRPAACHVVPQVS
jgi:hypothetical protein